MIQGLTVIVIAIAAIFLLRGIAALMLSKSEGARRLKLVLSVLLAIPVSIAWFTVVGPIGFGITLAVIAAIVWVVRGYRG